MPLPDPYPILTLHAADVLAPEEMGSKRKGWVRVDDDAEPWLFKYTRVNDGVPTGEAWAEKVAAEIAVAIGLPAARVELATLDGEVGCVSRQFAELSVPGVELVHGSDLLPGVVLGYDRTKRFRQADHTLENILDAVAGVIPDAAQREAAFRRLAGCVVLDALILNTDRHHENWALLRSRRSDGSLHQEVAPSYDHASSLARNEPAATLAQWMDDKQLDRVAWYAQRGHGGIFLRGDKRGANPLRLVMVAVRRWPRYFQPWLERVRSLDFSVVEGILRRVPEQTISPEHREFALALLRRTQHILSSSP